MRRLLAILGMLWLVVGMAQAQVTITNLAVVATTATSATIAWTTSGPASSQVLFGINGILNSYTPLDPTLVTSHSETITGIFNNAIFSYAAVSVDGASHRTQSATQRFQLCTSTGNTQTSGTIGPFYMYGTYSLAWVNESGQSISPTVCGASIATTISGSLDYAGSFSTPVPDNLQIVPSPSQWTVNVESDGGLGTYTTPATTITGVSANLNSVLQTGVVGKTSLCFIDQGAFLFYPPGCGGGGGGGGVSQLVPNTGAGSLSPLFTFGFATPTTTPTLSFTLNAAASNTVFGNCTNTSAVPNYCSIVAAMLPFTYSGTTLKLATVGATFSGTGLICLDGSGNLITSGCPSAGVPGTPLLSLQYDSAGRFTGAIQTSVVAGSGNEPAEVNIANLDNIYYNSGYNFTLSPSGTLVSGANTVTLASGAPAGLNAGDTAAASKWHYIYIASASGDSALSEPVLLTGGTCVGGQTTSCTITFNAAHAHIAGYQITSASQGAAEMFSDADTSGTAARTVILPNHTNFQWLAPVFTNVQRLTLEGGGSKIQCFFNDSCLIVGARSSFGVGTSSTYEQETIKDLMFFPGANFWSVSPSGSVAGGSPTATLTVASCPTGFDPLVPNQLLWLAGASGGAPSTEYGIGEYVKATGGTCTAGNSGTIIIQQDTPGLTNLSAHDAGFTLSNDVAPAIEDNANLSTFYNINIVADTGSDLFGHGLQIDNDQSAACYNCNDISGYTLRGAHGAVAGNDADFTGSLFYGPGPFSINAGLLHVVGGTSGGPVACLDWWDGNDVIVDGNFVCQGAAQFAFRMLDNLGGGGMKHVGPNVHVEGGTGTNSLGLIGDPNIITSNGPAAGLTVDPGVALGASYSTGSQVAQWPQYANVSGATLYQYYWAVPHNDTLTGCTVSDCYANLLPMGRALDNDPSVNNVTLTFPNWIPGASSYDILAQTTNGVVPNAPYGTGTFLVGSLTVNGTNCNTHAICTFVDNVAPGSRTSYTVVSDDTGSNVWYPEILTWAGSVISGTSTTTISASGSQYFGPPTCVTTTLFPTTLNLPALNAIAFTGTYPAQFSFQCIPQTQYAYIPNYGYYGTSIPGATLMAANANATVKGRMNFGFHDSTYTNFYDFITLEDSNWLKTLSSKDNGTYSSFRPLKDAADSFIGTDGTSGNIAFGCGASCDTYIGTIQDGASWVQRIISTGIITAVPLTIQGNLSLIGSCLGIPGCGPFSLSGTQVTDNFNRSAGPLGSNWTVTGSGSWAIVNNQAVASPPGSNFAQAVYTGSSFSNNQYASAKIIAHSGYGGVGVRLNSSDIDGYICVAGFGTAYLGKIVSGVVSSLQTISPEPAIGDILTIEAVGTSITCLDNGIVVASASDSSLSSGSPGMTSADAPVTMDNFQGGNYAYSASADLTVNNITVNGTCTGCGSSGPPAFSSITSGTNTSAAMVVGSGGSLSVTGGGTIGATTLLGNTWASPGAIGGTTPAAGAFTTLTTTSTLTGGAGAYAFLSPEVAAPASPASGLEACYPVAGSGLQCKDHGGNIYTMQSSGTGSFYQTVQISGSSLPQQPTLNFAGAGVTCVNNGGASRTDCTITGGGGATAFSSITTAANGTATMTLSSGGTLTFSGTGVVNANQLNGTAFAGTSGDLVSFGAANIPADSSIVAANVATATGTLTSNLVLLGGGSKSITTAASDTTTTHAFFATSGAPAFRAITSGDIPTLNQNTTGTAANLSGTPTLPNGTSATTQSLGDNTTKLATDAFVIANAGAGNVTTGGFTLNRYEKASGTTALSDSCVSDDGTTVTNHCTGGIVASSGNPSIQTQTTSNTDLAGTATMTGGTFTYSFLGTWASAPICVATDTAAANAVRVQTTTTTLTITGTSGDTANYICIERT